MKSRLYREEVPASILASKAKPSSFINVSLPREFFEYTGSKGDSLRRVRENLFAIAVPVNIDLLKQAEVTNDGKNLLYAVALKAKGALNLSVRFDEFYLPKGAILSIYNKREITDSITEEQNNNEHIWATKVYQGDELFLTVSTPLAGEKIELRISTLNAGFIPFGDFGNVGSAANCHVNVNCPGGGGWEPEKNTVALVVASGTERCTGALIMNTCKTKTPYFLTVNHALTPTVADWVFQFQTWSTSCTTNVGWIETVQYNGCQLRANNAASDFALLQLNTTPADNSGIHYAGWTRATTGITSTTILHHPMGDLMKISKDIHAPVAVTSSGVDCWQLNLDTGRVEGGSSGAPYFDQNHRIIGQHWKRPDAATLPVCDITVTLGGRFNQSWTGGGTNATRLSNWLDPTNSGITTTNTQNVSTLSTTVKTINGSSSFCTSDTFSISNLPAGTIVTWTTAGNIAISGSNTANPVTVVKTGSGGSATLTATFNACFTTVSKSLIAGIRAPGSLTVTYPGPASQVKVALNSAVPGATSYKWYLNGSLHGTTTAPNRTFLIDVDYPCNYTHLVEVEAIHPCGTSSKGSVTFPTPCSGLLLSPNPASEELIITISSLDTRTISSSKAAAGSPVSEMGILNLLNDKGQMVRSQKTTANGLVNFNVHNLPNGVYIVQWIERGSIYARKVVIVH